MNLKAHVERLFPTAKEHEAHVVILSGTNASEFSGVMKEMVPESLLEKMDENTSAKRLSLHPVMGVITTGTDGHIHVEMGLPLQEWKGNLIVEESIIDTKDIKRVTDYLAGFMDVFSMNGSITAYNLDTEEVMVGKEGSRYDLKDIIKQLGPKRTIPGLESIGSVEEILGQMTKKEIEVSTKKVELQTNPEGLSEMYDSFLELNKSKDVVASKDEKMLKEQKAVVKKYGYPALVEIAKKMNQPLLVKPHEYD